MNIDWPITVRRGTEIPFDKRLAAHMVAGHLWALAPTLKNPAVTGYRSVDGRVVPEIVLGASVTIEPDDPGLLFFLEDLMPDQPIRLVRSDVPVRR